MPQEMGSFPLRFPHHAEPDDAGWHMEGSFRPPGATEWWTNVHSTWKALFLLFLFTEVDHDDAPTRIRVGSHMDIPPVLRRHGDEGASMSTLSPQVDAASAHRPVTVATGNHRSASPSSTSNPTR
jgi:hypothetical protein